MAIEIRVPEVGESVQEAVLAEWFKADGAAVRKDEPLFLLETDKVTLEVPAEGDGVLRISVQAGSSVRIGDAVGKIEPAGAAAGRAGEDASPQRPEAPAKPSPREPEKEGAKVAKAGKAPEADAKPAVPAEEAAPLSPSVRELVDRHGLDPSGIRGSGPEGRLTRGDVLLHLEGRGEAESAPEVPDRGARPSAGALEAAAPRPSGEAGEGDEPTTRKPMSPIRKRIAERLLEAKHSTAMLTTFNEVDMGPVMDLRKRHKAAFHAKHGTSLGITSFFVQAACQALRAFPQVNAFIDGDDLVFHDYVHMGIAIGAPRGLVVPVIRHAERRSVAEIEKAVAEFVDRVRENKLGLADLEGGTFTITNGGVFGSLLSTPILNPPQSAILGLHKVEDRPVAVEGQVVVRPMMYVALSYDHRVIDGRDAVQFLVRVKQLVEEPERLWLEV